MESSARPTEGRNGRTRGTAGPADSVMAGEGMRTVGRRGSPREAGDRVQSRITRGAEVRRDYYRRPARDNYVRCISVAHVARTCICVITGGDRATYARAHTSARTHVRTRGVRLSVMESIRMWANPSAVRSCKLTRTLRSHVRRT